MRNRITFELTEGVDKALEELREVTGRGSKSEVIRDALELYDLVLQQLVAGKHMYLGTTKESTAEVLLPHLERAARRKPLVIVGGAEPAKKARAVAIDGEVSGATPRPSTA